MADRRDGRKAQTHQYVARWRLQGQRRMALGKGRKDNAHDKKRAGGEKGKRAAALDDTLALYLRRKRIALCSKKVRDLRHVRWNAVRASYDISGPEQFEVKTRGLSFKLTARSWRAVKNTPASPRGAPMGFR